MEYTEEQRARLDKLRILRESKRKGLPSNKIQLELESKKRAQLASGRAKNIYKAMDRSDKLKKLVETGARAVVGSVAKGEGIEDAKKKAKALEITDEHHAASSALLENESGHKEE
jgi:hypothetical protein